MLSLLHFVSVSSQREMLLITEELESCFDGMAPEGFTFHCSTSIKQHLPECIPLDIYFSAILTQ